MQVKQRGGHGVTVSGYLLALLLAASAASAASGATNLWLAAHRVFRNFIRVEV